MKKNLEKLSSGCKINRAGDAAYNTLSADDIMKLFAYAGSNVAVVLGADEKATATNPCRRHQCQQIEFHCGG